MKIYTINYSYTRRFVADRTQITLCSLPLYCSRASASKREATLSILNPCFLLTVSSKIKYPAVSGINYSLIFCHKPSEFKELVLK